MSKSNFTRRGVLQTGAVAGAGLALPTIITAGSHAGYTNAPTGSSVTPGFNAPPTGPHPETRLDELPAQDLPI